MAAGRTGRGGTEAAAEIGPFAANEAFTFGEQSMTLGPPNESPPASEHDVDSDSAYALSSEKPLHELGMQGLTALQSAAPASRHRLLQRPSQVLSGEELRNRGR
jgi:hypothetical protein